jgi:hypothetical protein
VRGGWLRHGRGRKGGVYYSNNGKKKGANPAAVGKERSSAGAPPGAVGTSRRNRSSTGAGLEAWVRDPWVCDPWVCDPWVSDVLARERDVLPMVELVRGSPWALCCLPPPVPPDTPDAPGAPADTETPPAPPDLSPPQRPWPGLDHLGALQAGGGVILGLIALFSSYDHITVFGRSIGLQQQWGIPLIAASVATVVIDSQLATRARDRAGDRADQERNRAAEARERQAETAERQGKSFERLDQAELLSARVQLDPSSTNRARLRAFLTLMGQRTLEENDGGP